MYRCITDSIIGITKTKRERDNLKKALDKELNEKYRLSEELYNKKITFENMLELEKKKMQEKIKILEERYLMNKGALEYEYSLKTEKLAEEYLLKNRKIDSTLKEIENKKQILTYQLNPTMIEIYNDFYEKYMANLENYFKFKKNPSYKSADYIREIKEEFKVLQIENRKLKLLLSEFMEEGKQEEKEKEENTFDNFQKAYQYSRISKEEWKKLTYIQKLDLTVTRYKEKWKNKLNIGLEFERYCGYLYEKSGYTVEYNGILKGKSDGGIDLIAYNKNKKIYIQCKYWSVHKQIRENTITQLFGSALKMAMDNGESYESFIEKVKAEKIRIALLTKTELSEDAKKFCSILNIIYKENIEINSNYPIIKGVEGEERIFYIPTDFHYDNIKYKSTYKKYCRFKTCEEAEKMGYRHCYKWTGNES